MLAPTNHPAPPAMVLAVSTAMLKSGAASASMDGRIAPTSRPTTPNEMAKPMASVTRDEPGSAAIFIAAG